MIASCGGSDGAPSADNGFMRTTETPRGTSSQGTLYVMSEGNNSVSGFVAGTNQRLIAIPVGDPRYLTTDAAGYVYVATAGAAKVNVYRPGQTQPAYSLDGYPVATNARDQASYLTVAISLPTRPTLRQS